MDTRDAIQNSLFGVNLSANLSSANQGYRSEMAFSVATDLATSRLAANITP